MRLEEHIFEEVAMALGAEHAGDEGLHRRRAFRYTVDGYVLIKPHGVVNSVPREAQLLNISAVGVCVVDRMTMAAGDQFLIYLPRAGGATMDVICTARQSRLASSGGFRIGAEFVGETDERVLLVRGVEGVMAAQSAMKPMDAETGVNLPAQIRLAPGDANAPAFAAEIREATGIAVNLMTGKALAAGEQFILEFVTGRRKAHAWLCMVTHVRAVGSGQFRVNARIQKLLDEQQGVAGLKGWFRRLFS